MKFEEQKTKKARVAFIKAKLAIDPRWAVAGLVKIFEYQTREEQQSEETLEHNGVGYSGCDAELLSSFAKQVKAGRQLSVKQMAIVFKKMPRYAGQLERISKKVGE